ncbi:MAG: 2-oxo acid dehydrogenase subunit E2 [Spirochaetales bacterium]|nr:2-oxo acid dehydrogenase subunit E2 [Spirochaetales bacterium]
MGIRKRCDGTLLKNLPAFRIINPYVMKGRNESAVYFSHDLRMKKAIEFIRKYNNGNGKNGENGKRLALFHVILCGIVRALALRPQLNRFVSGKKLYQRNRIQLSFIVKKELTEEGEESNVKITFSPFDTLEDVIEKVNREVEKARAETGNESDHEIEFFTKLPRSILTICIQAFKMLDYFGIAPSEMIRLDPLYTSIFVANLGSVGLDAPYHHMYEWGNASLFATIGKLRKGLVLGEGGVPVVEDLLTMCYTFDDRISEGMYAARAIDMFKKFIENPELLMEKPDIPVEVLKEHMLVDE